MITFPSVPGLCPLIDLLCFISDPEKPENCFFGQLEVDSLELNCDSPHASGFVSTGYLVTLMGSTRSTSTMPYNITSLSAASTYMISVRTT